jgi:hypothetical protein
VRNWSSPREYSAATKSVTPAWASASTWPATDASSPASTTPAGSAAPSRSALRSVPASTMSLLGLVRHLAQAERDWRNWIAPADPEPKLYGAGDSAFEGAAGDPALAEGAFADLAREQAATDAVLAAHPDLGASPFTAAAKSANRGRASTWRLPMECCTRCEGSPETSTPMLWPSSRCGVRRLRDCERPYWRCVTAARPHRNDGALRCLEVPPATIAADWGLVSDAAGDLRRSYEGCIRSGAACVGLAGIRR